MAQSFVDKYVFALMLDSSNFEKGANLATKAANGVKSTILKTYTALGGINLFKNMLTDYTDAARNIDTLSLTTGENIVKLQAWEKAIQDTGGNIQSFRGTLTGLNDMLAKLNMGQVDEKWGAMLKQGIGAFDKTGNLKKGSDLLVEISKAIASIEDNAEAFNWAKSMGIDESTFKLMRRYGENIESIIKTNERWAVINRRDIDNGRAYDKMISSFKTSWLQLSKVIMSNVLPILQKQLFPEIEKLTTYLFTHQNDVKGFFQGIGEAIESIMPMLKTAFEVVKGIGTVMGKYGKMIQETVDKDVKAIDETDIIPEKAKPYAKVGAVMAAAANPGVALGRYAAGKVADAKWMQNARNAVSEFVNTMNQVNIDHIIVQTNDPNSFVSGLQGVANAQNAQNGNMSEFNLSRQIAGAQPL